MNCVFCGKEANQAFLRLAGSCGEEHRQEVLRRHRALLEELSREEPSLMPETFCVDLFERLALKLVVHRVLGKAHILNQLPATHVALEEARGLAWLFRDGSYTFPQPVPAPMVAEAVRKARLLPLLGTTRELPARVDSITSPAS